MKSTRLVIVFSACLAAGALWPADAAAQHRGGVAVPRSGTAVVVSAGYYRPYYYHPYYYNPFFYSGFYGGFYSGFYGGFYAPFYAGWYPYYGQYPYPGYYGRSWASARLEMKPRDAQVFIDGYFVGSVDQFDGIFQRLDLPTGEHEIEVYMKGYRTFRQRTLFRPGETYHFKGILEPVPAGTPEEPAPQPSANAPDPYAPPARDPRDPYMRDPYGRQPGQDPNGPPPPPQAGEPGEPGRPMPPMPDRPGDPRIPGSNSFGTLNIRVQPGDATVVIDGQRWDSPDGGSRLSVQLAAGSHRVDVRKDGFKPYTTTIQIRPGDSQALNISLPAGQN